MAVLRSNTAFRKMAIHRKLWTMKLQSYTTMRLRLNTRHRAMKPFSLAWDIDKVS